AHTSPASRADLATGSRLVTSIGSTVNAGTFCAIHPWRLASCLSSCASSTAVSSSAPAALADCSANFMIVDQSGTVLNGWSKPTLSTFLPPLAEGGALSGAEPQADSRGAAAPRAAYRRKERRVWAVIRSP